MITLEKPVVRNIATESADWFASNRFTYLADPAETSNEYALIHAAGSVNGAPPAHVHSLEDEVFVMLKGEATFRVKDQTFRASAGSVVYLPRGLAHQPAEFSNGAEALILVTPGDFVGFFKEYGVPAQGPGLPTMFQADVSQMEAMLRLGNEYGITFLPPAASISGWPVPPIHAEPLHIEAKKGETLDVLGSKVTIKLEGTQTQSLFSIFEIEDPAGMNGPIHIHHADSEAFYVLEGAYEITIDDRIERAIAGSFVYVPKGVPRKRRNYAQTKGRILSITATSGHENFYREISAMKTFDPARLEVVARRYGIEILGK
jgi:mannose-6-phosphate isomerase-like protein (cupin superfamily)